MHIFEVNVLNIAKADFDWQQYSGRLQMDVTDSRYRTVYNHMNFAFFLMTGENQPVIDLTHEIKLKVSLWSMTLTRSVVNRKSFEVCASYSVSTSSIVNEFQNL